MKGVLITGIHGFVGTHLSHHLHECGYEIFGVELPGVDDCRYREIFGPEQVHPAKAVFDCGLASLSELTGLFKSARWETVIHLAGEAFPPASWEDPAAVVEKNILNTVNLLQAARDGNWKGRVLFVSSGDVYGYPPPERLPIVETAPLDPDSPYAASKLAAENMALLFQHYGIEVLIARPFNHIGPGQNKQFVVPAFLSRTWRAWREGDKTIRVGDLDSSRDFTDVRDVARAYELLIRLGKAGEIYNVCSGSPTSIGTILGEIFQLLGAKLEPEIDKSLLRPEGPSRRFGSAEKLKSLGWSPRFDLRQTIDDTREYMERNNQL